MGKFNKQKYNKQYRKLHLEKISKREKKYNKLHKEEKRLYNALYNKIHRKELRKAYKKYDRINKEKRRTAQNIRIQKKRNTDPLFKLRFNLRCRIRLAIKNNAKRGSAVKDLGCTIEFFKQYIEDKFYGKMTWKNWGKIWELDHIIPLWKFDLADREQFLRACNYKNMQPLLKEDHRRKSVRETKQFYDNN